MRVSSFIIFVALLVTPISSQAQVNSALYNSMSITEKITYLYGMVVQLQALIESMADNDSSDERDRSRVDIETRSATDIQDDEAELRAEIDLNGEDEAIVWFEYGQDSDDLDDRTSKRTITDSRGDERTISITIDDLDEDEQYYFRAIVEDEDGDRSYGNVRHFITDDGGGSGSSSSGDFDLSVSDTTIDEGDDVAVDWEVPDDETGTQNWIGLYEVGDSNRSYVDWKYIDNDESGTVTFTVDDEGDYEFRLFLDNDYDDEVTSREIVVTSY